MPLRSLVVSILVLVAGCGSGSGATANPDGAAGDAAGGSAGVIGSGGVSGGGAGTGGASGTAGAGGADGGSEVDGAPGVDAGADFSSAATDVTIIRGDPAKRFATGTFVARGFGPEYEGRLVFVRVGMPSRPPERLGAGTARFRDGGFSLPLPMGIELSLYKAKYAFVDVDGDGVCTADKDVAYQDFSFLDGDLTFVLEGSVPAAMGAAERTMLRTRGADVAAQVCDVMNGPWPGS
jgi:hypothetical protein